MSLNVLYALTTAMGVSSVASAQVAPSASDGDFHAALGPFPSGSWVQEAKLTASDGEAFGFDVAISGRHGHRRGG